MHTRSSTAPAVVTAMILLACTAGLTSAKPKPGVPEGDLPATLAVSVKVRTYGFVPVKEDYLIDQPQPDADVKVELTRADYGMPRGEKVPRWVGSREVALGEGYEVKIQATYMIGQPSGDFVAAKNGLSLNVSYFYGKELIDFESTTVWEQTPAVKAVVKVRDVPYCALLSRHEFTIPMETDGYMEGFRLWTAVRDGLNRQFGKCNFENLSQFLKPLNRKNNCILASGRIECEVAGVPIAKPREDENKK